MRPVACAFVSKRVLVIAHIIYLSEVFEFVFEKIWNYTLFYCEMEVRNRRDIVKLISTAFEQYFASSQRTVLTVCSILRQFSAQCDVHRNHVQPIQNYLQ